MSIASARRFLTKNPWYNLWQNARQRCENPEHRSYRYYGAIGIKFLISQHDTELIFNRDGGHFMHIPSLDRIDSTGHYTALNCRVIEKAINERLPHDEKLAQVWVD